MAPRDPLEALYRALLPTARKLLAAHGEFFPFAGAVDRAGAVELLGAGLEAERPPAGEVLAHLRESLRERAAAGELEACGLCSDVTVAAGLGSGPTDAVRLALEDEDGRALEVLVPYRRGADGEVALGHPATRPLEPAVFRRP